MLASGLGAVGRVSGVRRVRRAVPAAGCAAIRSEGGAGVAASKARARGNRGSREPAEEKPGRERTRLNAVERCAFASGCSVVHEDLTFERSMFAAKNDTCAVGRCVGPPLLRSFLSLWSGPAAAICSYAAAQNSSSLASLWGAVRSWSVTSHARWV